MVRLAVIGISLLLTAAAPAATGGRATVAFVGDLGLLAVGSDGSGTTQLRDGTCPPGTLQCPGAEAATWSPDGTQLAAVVGTQLWLFGTDGTSRLLPTGGAVSGARSSPAWSPDGRRIAFFNRDIVDGFGTLLDVSVIDVDSGAVRRLTVGNDVSDLTWAPGPQIVYSRSFNNRFGLFILAADGSARQLTRPEEGDVDRRPAWSPNGRDIAFVHLHGIGDEAGHTQLQVVDAAGGTPRTLSDDPVGVELDQPPAWSPDGTKLAFTTSLNGRPSPVTQIVLGRDLYVVNADGTGERRLTESAERDMTDRNPTWSADGTQLAFEASDREERAKTSIYAVNADGTCEHPLTDVPGARPAWQPLGATPPATCADLSVFASSPRVLGTAGRMVVTVLNDGSQPLSGVRLTSASVAATVRSAAPSQGSCAARGGALSCALGDLAPRRRAEVAVRVDSLLVTQAVGIVLGGRVTFRVAANEQESLRTDNSVSLEVETTRCAPGLPGAGHLEGTPFDDRVCGRAGADRIASGDGRDTITAGAGADSVDARDGEPDLISCGAGRDTVRADKSDRVAADCERVRR
jgi:Tol biopolymer transport system component